MVKIESKRLQRNPASSIHIGNCEYKRLLALVAGSNNNNTYKNVFKKAVCNCCIEKWDRGFYRKEKQQREAVYIYIYIVHELCESRGGRPGLSVPTCLMVSMDVKHY